MAHKLPRLSKSILEKPQLMLPSKFAEVAEVLQNRSDFLKTQKDLGFFDMDDEDDSETGDEYGDPSLGVLHVEGPTTYKPSGWEMVCGTGCAYTSLISQMKEFAEQGKKKVLMKVDSPGGASYRMMFSARELRRIADENDIKLIAYVDGMAASAGMGLASAAHEIIANPESELGSIGVVISLVDSSKAVADAGYRYIYITAGEKKRPFKEDGSFKEEFIADLKEDVDVLYSKFVTHVSEMRGISEEVIRNTEADMYRAEEALSLGLCDKVMEEPEFLEYLLGKDPKKNVDETEQRDYDPDEINTSLIKNKVNTNMSDTNGKVEMSTELATQLEAKLAEMTVQFEAKEAALAAELNSYKQKEAAEAKEALSAKLNTFEFASEQKEALMGFFMEAAEPQKELMNGVLAAANSKIATQEETLVAAEQAHLDALEVVKAEAAAKVVEADAALEEFGTAEQTAVEALPNVEAVDDTTARKKRVADLKAEKEAKNK